MDEAGFQPTHTMFLLTNERPKFPPTAAFRGRLLFVPFKVDFSNSKELTLENTLRTEIPGILWRLVKLGPSVFKGGLGVIPKIVQEESADLIDENDVAAPYIELRLEEGAAAFTPTEDVETDVRNYLGSGMRLGGDEQFDRIMEGVKARFSYGRHRVAGGKQRRGFVGFRLKPPETS
jgi:phage/plasmid-associated DNA primase